MRRVIDIRTIPDQDLSALLDSLAARFPGLEIERIKVSNASKTDSVHPLIRVLESCGARCVGAPGSATRRCFAKPAPRLLRSARVRSSKRTQPMNG